MAILRSGILGFDSQQEEVSFLRHSIQTGSEIHPAYYRTATGGKIPTGVKRPELEPDNSPPSSAYVQNVWSYSSTSPYAFIEWCLIKGKLYGFLCRVYRKAL
jgi:hypothetical protein